MAINFPSSPATNDTFTGPTGLEYIFDGVKWRSFKPSEPVVGTFNANSAISLSAGGTNQNIVLTPSGTGVVTTPASVGIGTTAPTNALHINRTVSSQKTDLSRLNGNYTVGNLSHGIGFSINANAVSSGIYTTESGGAGASLTFTTSPSYSTPTNVERMRIDKDGNVGIGTATPSALLTIDGGIITTMNYAATPQIRFNYAAGTKASPTAIASQVPVGAVYGFGYDGASFRNTSGILMYSDGAVSSVSSPGFILFATTPSGATSTTERMRITSAGNVGIGTVSPQEKLDVIGSVRIQAASGSGILNILPASGTLTSEIRLHSASNGLSFQRLINDNGLLTMGTSDANSISFFTNSAERVRILATGQLLIGGNATALTAIPGSLGNSTIYSRIGMTVVNDTTTLGYFQTYDSNATTDLKTWRHGGQTDGSYIFQTVNDAYNSSTTRLTIGATGILSDGKGDVRAAPIQTKSGAYVLVATDAGQTIYISTGGVTINASILAAGDMITIVNNSASNQTITAGASVTFRLAGTATTGNRTLAQYGMATFLCVVGGATPTLHCSGAGLT
jgi:hypothetical protein